MFTHLTGKHAHKSYEQLCYTPADLRSLSNNHCGKAKKYIYSTQSLLLTPPLLSALCTSIFIRFIEIISNMYFLNFPDIAAQF